MGFLNRMILHVHRSSVACSFIGSTTVISMKGIQRKVVGKGARDNPERHRGWFSVLFFPQKFEGTGMKGHGNVFSSAKGKQQK